MSTEAPTTPAPAPAPPAKPATPTPPAPDLVRPGRSNTPSMLAARERMQGLRGTGEPGGTGKPGGVPSRSAPPPKAPAAAPGATEKAPEPPPKVETPPEPSKPGEAAPGEEAAPPETPPGEAKKPPGPWQLKDLAEKRAKAEEARALKAETELAQLKTAAAEAEQTRTRLEAAEKRAEELEKQLRFVDYSKSPEFKDKYVTPYEKAYQQAVAQVRQLSVSDEEGNTRQATDNDLLALAQLPLGQVDKVATAWFGESAPRVIRSLDRFRETAEAYQQALKEAQEKGVEYHRTQEEATRRLSTENTKFFEEFRGADERQEPFLQAKEGDDEWNAKLEHERGWVDETFSSSAFQPDLTAEQRRKIVRDHASLRGRAIGFPMLKLENTRLRAELETAKAALAKYKEAEPGAGEIPTTETGAPAPTANRMQSALQGIRKMARPQSRAW